MARLACASLVKYCGGWFPFYSAVTICECHFSVTARYVKKKLPSLREVRSDTVWRTFEACTFARARVPGSECCDEIHFGLG